MPMVGRNNALCVIAPPHTIHLSKLSTYECACVVCIWVCVVHMWDILYPGGPGGDKIRWNFINLEENYCARCCIAIEL